MKLYQKGIVSKILTRQSLEQMTAVPRPAVKTTATVALWRTCNLTELLAILWTFSPAASGARVVADASSLRLCEVIDEDVTAEGVALDLLPGDGGDVTKVVVVEESHAAFQDVCRERTNTQIRDIAKDFGIYCQ